MLSTKELLYIEGLLATDKFLQDSDLIANIILTGLDETEATRLVMFERPMFTGNPFHQINWKEYRT